MMPGDDPVKGQSKTELGPSESASSAPMGRSGTQTMVIGVISDTHGLVRPEALSALDGSSVILHAGDVGSPLVLDALESIAPVIAVRGNNDMGAWAERLPATDIADVSGHSIYLLHDLHELDLDPAAAGFRVVVSGHSHSPRCEDRMGVLFLNPGSAGPRRFKLPITVARLRLESDSVEAVFVNLTA